MSWTGVRWGPQKGPSQPHFSQGSPGWPLEAQIPSWGFCCSGFRDLGSEFAKHPTAAHPQERLRDAVLDKQTSESHTARSKSRPLAQCEEPSPDGPTSPRHSDLEAGSFGSSAVLSRCDGSSRSAHTRSRLHTRKPAKRTQSQDESHGLPLYSAHFQLDHLLLRRQGQTKDFP